ncbi:MAG: hypothetical protein ABH821_03015 [archaeon]
MKNGLFKKPEDDFWSNVDYKTIHTIMCSSPHVVTKLIREKEKEILLKYIKNAKRIIWLGIGFGEFSSELFQGLSTQQKRKLELIAVDINKKSQEFCQYNVYPHLNKTKFVNKDFKDYSTKFKNNDLLLLEFNTYNNLEENTRKKVLKIIKQNTLGKTILTIFDPEYKKEHLRRYQWDASLGMSNLIKIEKRSPDFISFKFERKKQRYFSNHKSQKQMEKELTEAGINLNRIKIIKIPHAFIVVINGIKGKQSEFL